MPPIETSQAMLILWAVIGYGLGSIPFGLIVSRMMGLGNLREIGSGNIGATNVLRTGSKGAAALTLLLDAGKGAAAVLLARYFAGEDAAQIAGLAAFVGHIFPVWLRFRGGKGVATFLGVFMALSWVVGIALCVTWLLTAIIGKISSQAALAAAATSTVWVIILVQGHLFFLGIVMTLLTYWTHRANIARLRAGTEPMIGQK